MIKNGEVSFIINTTEGKQAIADSAAIRRAALQHKVTYTTTISGGEAFCLALKQLDEVRSRICTADFCSACRWRFCSDPHLWERIRRLDQWDYL